MSNLGRRFSDYFVVAGLDLKSGLEADQRSGGPLNVPPLARPFKAKVISHYPHSLMTHIFDENAVRLMCFPKGLSFTTSSKPKPPTVHPFIITKADSTRVYGSCLTFYEEVLDDTVCQAMALLEVMHSTEVEAPTDGSTISPRQTLQKNSALRIPESFEESAIVGGDGSSPSSFPSNDTIDPNDPNHGGITRGNLRGSGSGRGSGRRSRPHSTAFDSPGCPHYSRSIDRLYVTKAICLLMSHPYYSAGERVLRRVYELSKDSSGEGKLPLESYVYNALYEVPLPAPGRSVKASLGEGVPGVVLQSPGSLELPLLDVDFAKVCEILGLGSVIDILTCLLLEQRVLLHSSDYSELMMVSECLTGLLFPFSWPHVYAPILPTSHQTFLDAPVPFIMGIYSDPNDLTPVDKPNGVCVVDLDFRMVDLPEELPTMPHREELIAELQNAASRYKINLSTSKEDALKRSDQNSNDDSGMSSTDESLGSDDVSKNDYEFLHQSAAMAQITGIATKYGVIAADFKESFIHERRTKEQKEQREAAEQKRSQAELKKAKFTTAAREIVFNRMLRLFTSYDKFIILPHGTDMETWLNNRESMHNFDKETFLCDQPEAYLPFLCSFIESQMFATFIDNKILSNWEDSDPSVSIFDGRLSKLLDEKSDGQAPTYHECVTVEDHVSLVEKRLMQADSIAPAPHTLEGLECKPYSKGVFPELNERILNNQPPRPAGGIVRHRRERASTKLLSLERRESQILSDSISNSEAVADTQWKFVTTLLRECKLKTKRVLVDKMGHEAVALGHGDSLQGMEESTLIASLCDLLERIWNHGIVTKRGKSCLWQHLQSFVELEEMKDKNKRVDTFISAQTAPQQSVLPALFYHATMNMLRELNVHHLLDEPGSATSSGGTGKGKRRSTGIFEEKPRTMDPLPTNLCQDFKSIDKMKEVKTDVGKARAWIRLCLEKKLLASHLKELLTGADLTRNLYKAYAFLRCEDEREQAMCHLLSLKAADFYCYTNNFTATTIPYRVLVFPVKRFPGGYSTTSANCWLVLAGQLRESPRLEIPRSASQIRFETKTLGVLSTLRIGHDNTGISPRWLVDGVLVRNEITGHMYRFLCGRWLGKGVDDGSTERVLVGEQLPLSTSLEEAMESCQNISSRRSSGSPQLPRRPSDCKLGRSELQHILGDAINNLVKYFCRPERERGSITVLLCGDLGLVNCLDRMFQSGFKSARLFRNNLYVWDYFEKVCSYLKEKKIALPSFCAFMDVVNASRSSIGKDGKFQQLICLAIRDHLLIQWLTAFCQYPVTAQMYEDTAFLRDRDQVKHLVTTLTSLNEFTITLEPTLTQGLRLSPAPHLTNIARRARLH